MIRVELPAHLRTLARVGSEVPVEVSGPGGTTPLTVVIRKFGSSLDDEPEPKLLEGIAE